MQNIKKANTRHLYLLIALICIAMESGALYYQYILDYGPCILCVQIRAIVLSLFIIALIGTLTSRPIISRVLGAPLLATTAGFVYLSYQVLGVERGWFEGSCTFEAPFPDWLPLHSWLPAVFEAWELCGYTPELLWGVTMAEALMLISATLFVVSIYLLWRAFQPCRTGN